MDLSAMLAHLLSPHLWYDIISQGCAISLRLKASFRFLATPEIKAMLDLLVRYVSLPLLAYFLSVFLFQVHQVRLSVKVWQMAKRPNNLHL